MNGALRCLALALFVLAGPATAGTLELDGPLIQGGLVKGKTVPGARVRFNDRVVRVSGIGTFLIGFGRDAPPDAILEIDFPDGGRERRPLLVTQRDYPVQRIDGLPQDQVTPGAATLARIRAERALISAVRRWDSGTAYFESDFSWPLSGAITGVFGTARILNGEPRQAHNGIDIAAPAGTVIAAAGAGIVALAHDGMFLTGKTVMIDHGHGLTSIYVHMSEIEVADGDLVKREQPIGKVGATGRATGAHLHWGVSLFGVALDPELVAGPIPDRQIADQ